MSAGSESIHEQVKWTKPDSTPDIRPPVNRTKGIDGSEIEPVRTTRLQYRTAEISADIDGNVLPIAIVVSPDDLREMGVDPVETDAIEYRFEEDRLIIRSAD